MDTELRGTKKPGPDWLPDLALSFDVEFGDYCGGGAGLPLDPGATPLLPAPESPVLGAVAAPELVSFIPAASEEGIGLPLEPGATPLLPAPLSPAD